MTRSKESRWKKSASRRKDYGYYGGRQHGAHRVNNLSGVSGTSSQSASIASTQSFCDVATYAQIPYYSWTIYFSSQEYNENSPTVAKIDALIEFFENSTSESLLPSCIDRGLTIDVDLFFADSSLLKKWPTIRKDTSVKPQLTFDCIRAAFLEVMLRTSSLTHEIETFCKIMRIVRLIGINVVCRHDSIINASTHLELSSYGKLISIRGIVSNIGVQKFSSASVVLACTCKREIIMTRRLNAPFFIPRKCNVCGNGEFKHILDSPYQFTRIEQTIEIKDIDAAINQTTDNDAAVCTNTISVKLTGPSMDQFVPGDRIKVIGIPRVTLDAAKSGTPGLYPLYVDAISTLPLAENECRLEALDREIIERIRSEPDVLGLLVRSLCPNVQGHEIIKATLILGMFSGYFECRETRDYIHVLVIGDLGFGKSQLLRACAQIHPKGAYVRGCSIKCLEPTVLMNVRETSTPEEPRIGDGAFALASQGVCYIDELDKMAPQHQLILKCMEDRRVNTTNPDIKLDIEARTGIVGMINPMRKRYDLSKKVAENVNASEEFLSRFDMVFLMRDHLDTNSDKLICDRALELHTKRTQSSTERTQSQSVRDESLARVASRTLLQRLSSCEDRSNRLPEKIFQTYIHYARSNVKPEVPSGPRATIGFLCSLRYPEFKDSVTAERLVRTLIILSQACAKAALRAQVSDQDVYDAMEILGHTRFVKTKYEPVDGERPPLSGNSNKLTSNKVKRFLNDLKDEASVLRKSIFTTDELRAIAGKENLIGNSLPTLVSRLNEQGYLLKVGSNTYKLV